MTFDRPPVSRPHADRLLGGVCSGIAEARGVPVLAVRAVALALVALAGFGLVLYAAAWLILPSEDDPAGTRPREVVVLARIGAAGLGLAGLAVAAGTATVFGLGGIVLGCGAILGLAGVASERVRPSWVLLPVLALTLPSLALASADVRLARSADAQVLRPTTAPAGVVRGGLGTVLVDLRRTRLPASGVVPLRIAGGLRRTIVALPHDRCVGVRLRWDRRRFARAVATTLVGRRVAVDPDLDTAARLFGRSDYGDKGTFTSGRSAPVMLDIRFASQGGGIVVRDFPDGVDPDVRPDWPGLPGIVEPRPEDPTASRRLRRLQLRAWRRRAVEQRASKRRIDALLPGPCATRGAAR